jgi:hypothetical protein
MKWIFDTLVFVFAIIGVYATVAACIIGCKDWMASPDE